MTDIEKEFAEWEKQKIKDIGALNNDNKNRSSFEIQPSDASQDLMTKNINKKVASNLNLRKQTIRFWAIVFQVLFILFFINTFLIESRSLGILLFIMFFVCMLLAFSYILKTQISSQFSKAKKTTKDEAEAKKYKETVAAYPIPTHLKGLADKVEGEILTKIQSDYSDFITAFKFHKKFKALELTQMTEEDEFAMTIWGITEENEKNCIINPTKHGCSALMGYCEYEEDLSSTATVNFPKESELIATFQYVGDEADITRGEKSNRAEDYFEWFSLYKYENGKLEEVASIET